MENIFRIASNVSTPLALAGLSFAILFFLVRNIIGLKIFSTLAQESTFGLLKHIFNGLFVLSLVAMILGFVGFLIVRTKPPNPGPVGPTKEEVWEQQAVSLEDEVMRLRGSLENWNNSDADQQAVNDKAPEIAKKFETIPDDSIRPAYKIVKYEYMLYAYTMAAITFPTNSEQALQAKLDFCSKGLGASQECLSRISEVKEKYPSDPAYEQAMTFINEDEAEDRVYYLSALCLCIKASLLNDQSYLTQARNFINKVSPSHLSKYPIEKNSILKVLVIKN
jgi:hypothetical protein